MLTTLFTCLLQTNSDPHLCVFPGPEQAVAAAAMLSATLRVNATSPAGGASATQRPRRSASEQVSVSRGGKGCGLQ